VKDPKVWTAGLISGVAWWGVSLLLGAEAYGIVGSRSPAGILAGAGTGLAITALSLPIYRRKTLRHLLWLSPLGVYLAVALYGGLIGLLRSGFGEYHPDQSAWETGVGNVLGMWWGITVVPTVGLPVHGLAYVNHRLLRRMARERAAPETDPRTALETP
jgi:hypothetical protein